MINKIRDAIEQVLHSLDVGGEQFRRLVEKSQSLKDTVRPNQKFALMLRGLHTVRQGLSLAFDDNSDHNISRKSGIYSDKNARWCFSPLCKI